jgi:large subunit ribosomal protein L7Ae
MNVPYCIVKGKARLGAMVYKKTATALCLTEVNKEDLNKLEQCIASYKLMYLDAAADRRKWGGGIMGFKAMAVLKKREKAATAEANKAALSVI